jgi:arginase family enzyme
MNYKDFFDPISVDLNTTAFQNENAFCHKINIHTASQPIDNLDDCQIAIVGVCEDRNSDNKGTALAPDKIRESLYPLFWFKRKLKIVDLGNLKPCTSVSDSYFGLREVLIELASKNIVTIILGGSQDLTLAMNMAALHLGLDIRLVSIDSTIDYSKNKNLPVSRKFLYEILNTDQPVDFVNIGHQTYYVDPLTTDHMVDNYYTLLRLGQVRFNMADAEPYFRNANLISFDLGAVKYADAPGTLPHSPNGFVGEEFCQLARYAGISSESLFVGFFECNPEIDKSTVTESLAAQAIWYFIEGFIARDKEVPDDSDNFKRFLVHHPLVENNMIFFRSNKTSRWWMEIPLKGNMSRTLYIPCTYADYQNACNEEIPDRWWHYYQRFN